MHSCRIVLIIVVPILLFAFSCKRPFSENPAGSSDRKFNREEIRTLRYELNYKDMTCQRAAVIKGLLWLLDFVQDEKNFRFIFTNYIPMLFEISIINNDPVIQNVTKRLIKNESLRGSVYIDSIYDKNNTEDIILMIGILQQLSFPHKKYLDHYNKNLTVFDGEKSKADFDRAAKSLDYDKMTDGLCEYSHFRFAYKGTKNDALRLPPDYRGALLEKCASTPFVYTIRNASRYHDQNYFATHVVFFMAGYGASRVPDSPYARKLKKYLADNFNSVRTQTDDLDLLGEYVECMKILGLGEKAEVNEALDYIVSQQNPNGSWVRETEGDPDPYDLFHPSWTSITALHYNLGSIPPLTTR